MPEAIIRSERLSPAVRALLELLDAQAPARIENLSVEEARRTRTEGFKKMGGPLVELGRVENLRIPGLGGEISLRLYSGQEGGGETGFWAGVVFFMGAAS